jgi:hypothetical protein
MQAPLICEQCENDDVIRIADPRATADDGELLAHWGDSLTLTNGHYLCPKCNAIELRFENSSIDWD